MERRLFEMRKFAWLAMTLLAACASGTGGTDTAPTPSSAQGAARVWPVLTRHHVDLWLHGYAMLLRDTATVPVFRRGYRERLQEVRTQRGVSSMLDANRERLQSRLATSPALFNGQFLPMYFANWDQMRQMIGLFIQAQGNPQAAGDQATAQYFAVIRQSFGTQADREWLRLFTEALEDERRQFYQVYWSQENGNRIHLVRQADSLWTTTYRAKLQGFLNNTRQEAGDMILALTLGGEGRTVNFSSRQNAVAVAMPEQDAREALYVFAHEIVGAIVATAVNDNITPTEQRSGAANRFVPIGQVRGGAMLLQRTAPELVAGYTRYYLMQGGFSTTGDINARLVSSYPLPDLIRDAIDRQLDVVLGGI
jgi:hypothetical protein